MATNTEVIRGGTASPSAPAEHGTIQSDAGGTEVARTSELGTSSLEAAARAMIQARFWVSKQPGMMRNWDQVEQRLIRECKRPGFANSAWFVLPIGNDANKYPAGFTIRFAEAALRMCGNIDVEQMVIADDSWKRTVRVRVLDLETNFGYTTEVVIDKTVERSNAKDREVLSYRQNSYGKMTYVVAASEQEVAMKQGSAVSKAIRTSGLRLIPGDILDESKKLILATKKAGVNAEDPENARKALLDNFAELGVMPVDIAKYVEHDTDNFQPAERELLRGIFRAIKDGHATWKDVLEAKFGSEDAEESEGARKVKEALEKRKASTAPVTQPATKTEAGAAAPPATQTTQQPSSTTSTPTPGPIAPTASQAAPTPPQTDLPPANLPNLDDFPETIEPTFVKVKGVIYKMGETGYREVPGQEKPAGKGKRERGALDFGGDK